MVMMPVEQTYNYILEHWQSQTLDSKKSMCNHLEHLSFNGLNVFAAAVLQHEIRLLIENIRLHIDQEITWSYTAIERQGEFVT